MCGSMVDIQSATAENRRGKKQEKEERKKATTATNNGLPRAAVTKKVRNAEQLTQKCHIVSLS